MSSRRSEKELTSTKCGQCNQTFGSANELSEHYIEAHRSGMFSAGEPSNRPSNRPGNNPPPPPNASGTFNLNE